MIRNSLKLTFVGSILALTSAVNASPTPWDLPAGSQPTFNFSGGQTDSGKLGSSIATGSGFFFTPVNFVALSNTPSSVSSDTISVILNAKPNQMFTSISSSILGDFSMFGVASASATGSLKITNLDTASILTSPLSFNNLPAAATSADGGWDGATALALPAGWTNIKVEMESSLLAEGSQGLSLIQAKDGEIGVNTAEIPLPAAALVVPVLAVIGWRARKKLAR